MSRVLSWVLVAAMFLLGAIAVSQQWRLDRALRRVESLEKELEGLSMSEASKTINGVTWTWHKGQGDWPSGEAADPLESGETFRRRVEAWCASLGG